MKKVILKPNLKDDQYTAILDDIRGKGDIGVYNYLSNIDELNERNLLAGVASRYFRTDCYCLEMDEKTLTMFGLKHAENIQKILPDEIDPAFLKMTRHLSELSNALSDLQTAESDLSYDYEEITGRESRMYSFNDIDIEEYRDYYSLENSSIDEVFEELLT